MRGMQDFKLQASRLTRSWASRVVDPSGRVLEQAWVSGQQLLISNFIHDIGLCVPQKRKMPMAGVNSKLFGAMWAEGLKAVGSRMKIDW